MKKHLYLSFISLYESPTDILGGPTPLPTFLCLCLLYPFFFSFSVGLVFLEMQVFLRVSRVFDGFRNSSGS